MKKEFSFQWCVLRNPDNCDTINNWFRSNGYGHPYHRITYIWFKNYLDNNFDSDPIPPKNYRILSFEEFQTLIMNNNSESYEIY